MLAMDRRITEATQSHPCAAMPHGALLFACLPAFDPGARVQRGFIESVSDRHHRRRR